jgi:hypothetical protein
MLASAAPACTGSVIVHRLCPRHTDYYFPVGRC